VIQSPDATNNPKAAKEAEAGRRAALCSCTNRTARSRTSGAYVLGRPMDPSSQRMGLSETRRDSTQFSSCFALAVERGEQLFARHESVAAFK